MNFIVDIIGKLFYFFIDIKEWITKPIEGKLIDQVLKLIGISGPITPFGLILSAFGVLVLLMLVKKVVPVLWF